MKKSLPFPSFLSVCLSHERAPPQNISTIDLSLFLGKSYCIFLNKASPEWPRTNDQGFILLNIWKWRWRSFLLLYVFFCLTRCELEIIPEPNNRGFGFGIGHNAGQFTLFGLLDIHTLTRVMTFNLNGSRRHWNIQKTDGPTLLFGNHSPIDHVNMALFRRTSSHWGRTIDRNTEPRTKIPLWVGWGLMKSCKCIWCLPLVIWKDLVGKWRSSICWGFQLPLKQWEKSQMTTWAWVRWAAPPKPECISSHLYFMDTPAKAPQTSMDSWLDHDAVMPNSTRQCHSSTERREMREGQGSIHRNGWMGMASWVGPWSEPSKKEYFSPRSKTWFLYRSKWPEKTPLIDTNSL